MENLGVKYLKAIYRKHGERISDPVIKEVLENLQNGKIMKSEYQNRIFRAVLYFLSDEEKKQISLFEKEKKVKVCHVILRNTVEHGMEYIYIITPKDSNDLDSLLAEERCFANVSNNNDNSMGYVGIRPAMGGFERIW